MPRKIEMTEETAWRIYRLIEEMHDFLHQPMNYETLEDLNRWLEKGTYKELHDVYYKVVGPWFPVDDETGYVIGPGGVPHKDDPREGS